LCQEHEASAKVSVLFVFADSDLPCDLARDRLSSCAQGNYHIGQEKH